MKINLGKQVLDIGFKFKKKPNLEKLSDELSDFFSENDIEGIKIKEFI